MSPRGDQRPIRSRHALATGSPTRCSAAALCGRAARRIRRLAPSGNEPYGRRLRSVAAALTTLVLASVIAGCGGSSRPQTVPVQVAVRLADRKPLPGARVSFRSIEHAVSARGVAGDDGVCQMTTYERHDGAVLGIHQVAIGPPALMGDPDKPQPRYPIAPRLGNFSTSKLEVNVSENADENRFEFQVTPR